MLDKIKLAHLNFTVHLGNQKLLNQFRVCTIKQSSSIVLGTDRKYQLSILNTITSSQYISITALSSWSTGSFSVFCFFIINSISKVPNVVDVYKI